MSVDIRGGREDIAGGLRITYPGRLGSDVYVAEVKVSLAPPFTSYPIGKERSHHL